VVLNFFELLNSFVVRYYSSELPKPSVAAAAAWNSEPC